MWPFIVSLLRDAIWQFIGVVISAFTFFATIWFYLKQRKRRIIAYKILFKTKKWGEPAIICLKIRNCGNIPIIRDDFEHPIIFDFGYAKVLKAKLIKTKPIDLMKPATKNFLSTTNSISLKPLLLNPRDTLYIEVELDFFTRPTPNCRITGGTCVSKLDLENMNMIEETFLFPFYISIVMIYFMIANTPYRYHYFSIMLFIHTLGIFRMCFLTFF